LNTRKPSVKAFVALTILPAIVAVLLVYPFIQLHTPSKPLPRHANPATETELSPFPVFLILLVRNVFDSLIGGEYADAAERLKTLGAAYIPERYRFVADRFMQLMNRVSALLDDTENRLGQAEALITVGKLEDAKPLLNEASGKLASANTTYIELRSASEELAKTFSLPAGELRVRVDELGRVIERLYEKLLRLLEAIEKKTKLVDSYLMIEVTPETVWTGGNIEVRGRLYTMDGGLAGRAVQIFVDGGRLAEGRTDEVGWFHVRVNLPYVYRPKVQVHASYVPKELDSEVYKPSASNIVEVSLLYVKPAIRAMVVGEALPGKTFTLKGSVEAEKPLPYSSLKVTWAGYSLTTGLEDRSFEAALYTPEDAPEGEYSLRIEAPAWQVFAPAERTIQVTVKRLPLNVTLQPPKVVFAGLPTTLNGEVLYGGEEFNLSVKVLFGGLSYTTRSRGEFAVELAVPLTVFSGYQDYEVYVSPDPPWYRPANIAGSIMVINPLTMFVPVLLVSVLALRLSGGRKFRGAEPTEGIQQYVQQPSAKAYSFSPELEWLTDLYWQVVAMVSDLTGVEMRPYMTMREYLEAVGPRLGGLMDGFEAVTMAAEKAVYSPTVSAEELESARRAFEEFRVVYVEASL